MEFKKFKLNERVINDLKKRSTIGIPFLILITLITISADGYYHRHPQFSRQFFIMILLICAFRFCHLFISKQIPKKFETASWWIFLASIIATGVIWGLHFAAIMAQPGEIQVKLLVVTCTIGVTSGAVLAYTPKFALSFAYTSFMIVPAIYILVRHQANLPLAALMFLYYAYISFMAAKGCNEYWTALENEHRLKKKSDALEITSRLDSLTGLYNRRYFNHAFSVEWNRALRNQTPLTVILCDIDHFKRINDEFGHIPGDHYLKGLAMELTSVFKRQTDIIARFGGEEFIILMGEEDGANAVELAETFRANIETYTITHENQPVNATISIGICTGVPKPKDKRERLIAMADTALYRSKAAGRNRITVCD